MLLKSAFALHRAAYEADSFHRDTDDAALYAGVEGREQVAGKSVELAEYFHWLRATGTTKQLQQTYVRAANTTNHRLSSHIKQDKEICTARCKCQTVFEQL